MHVRIAEDVLLVAPLQPGEDLAGGAEVEVPDAMGREWIARGWATELPVSPGDAETQRAE